jgi:hypothetical protein
MDKYYFIGCPEVYFSGEVQIHQNVTTIDVVLSFFLGILLITVFTLVLDQWQKEQIKEMEEKFRLLEYQLLNWSPVIR